MDQRRARRRPIRYNAWMAIEGEKKLQECVLSDVSETGARIEVLNSKKLPDRFMLLLSENGSARRVCRVVWRKPRYVGVAFERRHGDTNAAAGSPASDAVLPPIDTPADGAAQAAEAAPAASE